MHTSCWGVAWLNANSQWLRFVDDHFATCCATRGTALGASSPCHWDSGQGSQTSSDSTEPSPPPQPAHNKHQGAGSGAQTRVQRGWGQLHTSAKRLPQLLSLLLQICVAHPGTTGESVLRQHNTTQHCSSTRRQTGTSSHNISHTNTHTPAHTHQTIWHPMSGRTLGGECLC